jgi:hypothetical protein
MLLPPPDPAPCIISSPSPSSWPSTEHLDGLDTSDTNINQSPQLISKDKQQDGQAKIVLYFPTRATKVPSLDARLQVATVDLGGNMPIHGDRAISTPSRARIVSRRSLPYAAPKASPVNACLRCVIKAAISPSSKVKVRS